MNTLLNLLSLIPFAEFAAATFVVCTALQVVLCCKYWKILIPKKIMILYAILTTVAILAKIDQLNFLPAMSLTKMFLHSLGIFAQLFWFTVFYARCHRHSWGYLSSSSDPI